MQKSLGLINEKNNRVPSHYFRNHASECFYTITGLLYRLGSRVSAFGVIRLGSVVGSADPTQPVCVAP